MPARKSQPSPKPPRLNMMLIVADIHDRTGIPKEYISATLRGFKELVRDSMVAGVDIDMGADFGKFVAIEVAGREHYVPATGSTTRTPVRRKIRFRPGSRAFGQNQRKMSDHSRRGRHQDRAQPRAGRFNDGGQLVLARLLQMVGEFDDQNSVL